MDRWFKIVLQVVEVAGDDGIVVAVVIHIGEGDHVARVELGQAGVVDFAESLRGGIKYKHPRVVMGPTVGSSHEVGMAIAIQVHGLHPGDVQIGQTRRGGMVGKACEQGGG